MATLVMVSGSLRAASTNGAVVRAAAEFARAHPAVDVHIASIGSLPLFDEDVEAAGDPVEVVKFKNLIARADAVVISTPEYNASVPGVLKNAIDWASRPYGESVLTGKRVAVLSASPSNYGGRWAQDHLRAILDQRVTDGVIRRTIDKWLKAGVMEEGRLSYRDEGTPQGGVISPLLSNIFLDEVLDKWYEREVKIRLKGRSFLVRFADDFVMGFEHREDAERVLQALPQRFGKYGLQIHPEKTRLLPFERPARLRRTDAEGPATFDFLGFTFYWGRSRQWISIPKVKTSSKRQRAKLKRINAWAREIQSRYPLK
jgi:NAD(P)H-dependent FMN reductase